jgi:hypothetical protein
MGRFGEERGERVGTFVETGRVESGSGGPEQGEFSETRHTAADLPEAAGDFWW